MEIKKSPDADLEPYRATWLMAGFVVALALLFVAFEWSGQEEPNDLDALFSDLVFEEELDVPQIDHPVAVPPPPAPVAPPPPAVEEKVEVVQNDAKVEQTAAESSEQGAEESTGNALPADMPAPAADSSEPYVIVDELPEFPTDGQRGLMRYLTQHIRYPQAAWARRIQGTVLCQFIVNADGRITDVQVLQGAHALLDKEAVRVLSAMPRWKPGKVGGKAVRVRFTLPVVFRLQ